MFRWLRFKLRKSRGQTMTEYALLLAGIAIAALAGYRTFGTDTNTAVGSTTALLSGSSTTTPGSGGGSGGGGGDGDHHDHDGH